MAHAILEAALAVYILDGEEQVDHFAAGVVPVLLLGLAVRRLGEVLVDALEAIEDQVEGRDVAHVDADVVLGRGGAVAVGELRVGLDHRLRRTRPGW